MHSLNKRTQATSRWHSIRAWFVGLLLIAGLIVVVSHYSEIEHLVQLLQQAEPLWLILAFVFQACTYFSVAAVWHQALRVGGLQYPFLSLVPLGVAKLFSDQAMPSGGVSGTAFFITALSRRGISAHLCMATMLVSLVAYYAAYLIAAILSILLLWFYHKTNAWIISITVVFCLVALAIPAGALLLRHVGKKDLPAWLVRIPGMRDVLRAFSDAPLELFRNPSLILTATLLHGTIFILDSATLWVMLQAVGQHASFWVALPSFVLASIVATLGPIPLGLGTFETTCVAILGVLGIPLEAALTATLLLRGFTLWIPMVPGLWWAKRELK